jgi:hypothetical protein
MSALLSESDGELVLVRVSVKPHLLEDLLELMSGLPFPINPQIRHEAARVVVEFPAYSSQKTRIEQLRIRLDLPPEAIAFVNMLEAIQGSNRQAAA